MELGTVRDGGSARATAATGEHNIHATGLNAHHQIQENEGKDLHSFVPILDNDQASQGARVLFTCWSSTVLVHDSKLIARGFQKLSRGPPTGHAQSLVDAFGDHNGMQGCIDTDGNLYLMSDSGELIKQSDGSSPKIGHIAIAGNGKLALSFKQAPNGRLCHILQFESFDEFKTWFYNPSGVNIEPEKQHFMMQGCPVQLVASTGTFMILMAGGEVYTWGDPRYQSLGRSIADTPAHRPGLLEALDGINITKVAAGGWMGAAVSEDQAVYVWGAGMPGVDKTVRVLREAGAGEVALVSILPNKDAESEPLDILDVGVGDNHLAVITEGGRVFVVGDNKNGQLGLDIDEAWIDDWMEVRSASSGSKFKSVVCGPKATFVSIDSGNHDP